MWSYEEKLLFKITFDCEATEPNIMTIVRCRVMSLDGSSHLCLLFVMVKFQ